MTKQFRSDTSVLQFHRSLERVRTSFFGLCLPLGRRRYQDCWAISLCGQGLQLLRESATCSRHHVQRSKCLRWCPSRASAFGQLPDECTYVAEGIRVLGAPLDLEEDSLEEDTVGPNMFPRLGEPPLFVVLWILAPLHLLSQLAYHFVYICIRTTVLHIDDICDIPSLTRPQCTRCCQQRRQPPIRYRPSQ